MSIGKTITRGGEPILAMPTDAMQFVAVSFSPVYNTQIGQTPYDRTAQTNELPGMIWKADFTLRPYFADCDKDHCGTGRYEDALGEIKAWQMKLRGAAGKFLGFDGAWRCNNGVLGTTNSQSVDVTVPAQLGQPLYPSTDLYPADDLYPSPGTFAAYPFTLSASYDASASLVVSADVAAGRTLTVNPININEVQSNSNPWDYSNGVNPLYEESLAQGKKQLDKKMNNHAASTDRLLMPGDYVQVDDMLLMITEPFKQGDTQVHFEPALRHPVTAGTVIDHEEPGCVMRLMDDEQISWNARSGKVFELPLFSAVETFS